MFNYILTETLTTDSFGCALPLLVVPCVAASIVCPQAGDESRFEIIDACQLACNFDLWRAVTCPVCGLKLEFFSLPWTSNGNATRTTPGSLLSFVQVTCMVQTDVIRRQNDQVSVCLSPRCIWFIVCRAGKSPPTDVRYGTSSTLSIMLFARRL